MSAQDVIGILDDHGRRNHPSSWHRVMCECGWESTGPEGEDESQYRNHLACTVTAGGYAVVKLPEPDGEDDDGQVYFADSDIRVDTTGTHGPTTWIRGSHRPPELLRQDAAHLLAAAAYAEAVDRD